jgi:gliding motility-associated-like protein
MYSVDKTSGCQEHCMKFSDMSLVSNGQITSWKWSYNGNEFSQQANPNLCINQAGDYDISLIVTSNYGCTDTLTYPNFIHVFPLPVANYFTDNNNFLVTDVIQFRDQSIGNNQIAQWLWDFGDGNIANTTNPTHSFADTGTYKVSLVVTNNYGCMDTMYTYFYINDDFTFYIPNSFTPNRDMKNDVWNVKGRGIKEYKLEIYNRWGQMIYDTADITEGWNGRLRNSNEIVQNGTYTYKIYVFDKNNQEHYYMGHVNLIR